MPNFTTTTTITTGRGDTLSASKSGSYIDVFNVRQEVDNSTGFISLLSARFLALSKFRFLFKILLR